MQEITNAEVNKPEEEIKDASNIDKVELIHFGKQIKKIKVASKLKRLSFMGKII